MSKASQIRRGRKLRRGVGKARLTYREMMDRIAVKAIRRVMGVVGRENVKVTQDSAFSLVLDVREDRAEVAKQILVEEGYVYTRGNEFIHRKTRLDDFVSVGGHVSLVPMWQPPISQGFSNLPAVSQEELAGVSARLNSPVR